MPKLKSKSQLRVSVPIPLNAAEKQAIRSAARREGLPLATWARRVLLEKSRVIVEPHGVEKP
jgi:hypothetical protein